MEEGIGRKIWQYFFEFLNIQKPVWINIHLGPWTRNETRMQSNFSIQLQGRKRRSRRATSCLWTVLQLILHPPVSTASHESSHWREALQFSQCSKSFCQQGTLHMKVHTGEKPYSCSQCSRSFAESFNLNNHVRREHAGERPFSCYQCAKIFFFSGELKKHVAVHNIQQISAEDILSVISNHCINL